jgi:hypothetical protein
MDPLSAGITAGAGLLGGFFGGGQQPELTPEQQRIYNLLLRQFHQQMRFANSIPMSRPQEQLALAENRGQAGTELSNQRERVYAALGPNDQANSADTLSNLAQSEVGTLSGIDSQHFLNALNQRYQAKQQAPQLLGMAGGIAGQGQVPQASPFGAALGQLASAYAYSQNRQTPAPLSPTDVRPISGLGSNNAPMGYQGMRGALQSDLWR